MSWGQQERGDSGWGGGGGGGDSFGGGYDGGAIRIDIPANYVGRIIGKGGSKIREIQDMSGARIKLLKEEASAHSTPCEIGGNPECQRIGKEMIEEILSQTQSFGGDRGGGGGGGGFGGGRGGGGGGGGGGGYDNGEVTRIDVPSSYIGKLIGKGGSKIRELQDNSGCHIKVMNDEQNSVSTPVDLRGDAQARQTAKYLIEEWLEL